MAEELSMMNTIPNLSVKNCFKYRNEIYAIAAIWIVLFHINGEIGFPVNNTIEKCINALLKIGNLGVDIFLVFSAAGLCRSMKINSVSKYYYHRINRVLVPYLVLAVIFFTWYDLVINSVGVLNWFLDVLAIQYWVTGNYPLWYVSFISITYLVFPVLYYLDTKSDHKITILLICISIVGELLMASMDTKLYMNCERALSRIPVFLFGIIVGNHKSDFRISNTMAAITIFVEILLMILIRKINMYIILVRYIYGLISICIILSYTWLRNITRNIHLVVVEEIGKMSFEVYMIHVFILRIIDSLNLWRATSRDCWYIIIVSATLLISKVCSRIINNFRRLMVCVWSDKELA